MPRACTICTHPDRHEIEKGIVDGLSNRGIAKQHAVGADAILRHKRDHFPQALAESVVAKQGGAKPQSQAPAAIEDYVQRKTSTEQAHVVDVFHELFIQLDRLGKLYDAIHEWLSDPDDLSKYSIDPRAEDVTVIYRDTAELEDGIRIGGPRQKAKLSVLLGKLEGAGLSIEATETKHADPRELLVKVSAELRAQMQLRVSIVEKLYNAQEIERFKASVLDALGEVEPHVRRAVEDNLRRRQPLPGLTGPPLR